jgi:hypothetical protein
MKTIDKPVVDFDYFYFDQEGYRNNRDLAAKLALILIANAGIDDLHGINDEEGVYFDSSVGTGGGGFNFACPNKGSQRACLASLFASYSHREYQSCYLSIYEYQCLKELLDDIDDDCPPSHRERQIKQNVDLLNQVLRKFEIEYTKEVPGFLFTLLKNQK